MDTAKRADPEVSPSGVNPLTLDSVAAKPTIVIVPRTSRLTACGTCREQRNANDYVARMALFEEAAHRFHERELKRAYVEYKGGPVDWETGRPIRAVPNLAVAA